MGMATIAPEPVGVSVGLGPLITRLATHPRPAALSSLEPPDTPRAPLIGCSVRP